MNDTLLEQACKKLHWQGGTIHQVLEVLEIAFDLSVNYRAGDTDAIRASVVCLEAAIAGRGR